jgi:hypothetical protein
VPFIPFTVSHAETRARAYALLFLSVGSIKSRASLQLFVADDGSLINWTNGWKRDGRRKGGSKQLFYEYVPE